MSIRQVDGSELARRVNRTPTTVSRWRNGIQEPSFEDLDAIARALSVQVFDFFSDPTEEITAAAYAITVEDALRVVTDAAKRGGMSSKAPTSAANSEKPGRQKPKPGE